MHKMNWRDFFINGHESADSLSARRMAIDENYRRGSFLAILIIVFEAVFIVFTLIAMAARWHDTFPYASYLTLYSLLLAASGIFLAIARTRRPAAELDEARSRSSEHIVLVYIMVIMCWGSVVSLLDQKLYAHPLAFIVNMIACSIFFIVEWRRMLIPFGLSSLILLVGLPFVQKSSDVLIGHYVNISVFIIMAWLGSRLLYQAYHRDLRSRLDLEEANRQLFAEIREKQQINEKLNNLNFQLRNLSMVDELTGVANRRGLRNFIDQAFAQQEQVVENLGALMIDIDHFKQYNDSFGHAAGDQALSAIAARLEDQLRPPLEMVARWGGEEFLFISFSRGEEELHELAETLRQQVEHLADLEDSALAGPLTVSIGTGFKAVGKPSDVGPVIEDADMAMYSAKRAGRNKIWSIPPRIGIVPVESAAHVETVASLARKIWREHYTPIIGAEQVEYMLDRFQTPHAIWRDIEDKDYTYDLISYQGEWAGYMAACPDHEKKALFLSKLYIDSMYRGNQLARRLLDRLVIRSRAFGYGQIYLTVNKHNESSITAYKKMGFVRSKAVVTDIGGGFVMDDYIMTLAVGP